MLAMCAIRDHLSAPDLQQKARVSKTYLVNEYYEADAYTKLLPTKADRASFLACLNSTADAGGTDNIGRAYRYFRQELAGADDPSDPFDISSIERVISDQLALVAITADAVHLPTLMRMCELTLNVHDGAFSRRMQVTGHSNWEKERGRLPRF